MNKTLEDIIAKQDSDIEELEASLAAEREKNKAWQQDVCQVETELNNETARRGELETQLKAISLMFECEQKANLPLRNKIEELDTKLREWAQEAFEDIGLIGNVYNELGKSMFLKWRKRAEGE